MFNSLLIPADSVSYSDKALAEEAKLAKSLDANRVVLYIMENPVVLSD
jgi:hypothetical protein